MTNTEEGKIKVIAVMGKSGAGKDYIMKQMLAMWPDLHEIVSCTTRAPRSNERDGIDYHFLTVEDFIKQTKERKFIEWNVFNNWYYGTRISDLDTSATNIGVFNPRGVRALLADSRLDVQVFYVIADARTRMLRQLERDVNVDVNEVVRRYGTDEEDFADLDSIPYMIIENNGKVNPIKSFKNES